MCCTVTNFTQLYSHVALMFAQVTVLFTISTLAISTNVIFQTFIICSIC